MKFRKKPVVIEAYQWFKNGDHPDDYSKDHDGIEDGKPRIFTAEFREERSWEGDIVRYFRRPDVLGTSFCSECGQTFHVHGWIDTKEDGHRVCPGDWIITGIQGERYPCKPDIFSATYEPADSIPAPSASGATPPGWVMVPREPTAEMLEAADMAMMENHGGMIRGRAGIVYKTMLSAAERAEVEPTAGDEGK